MLKQLWRRELRIPNRRIILWQYIHYSDERLFQTIVRYEEGKGPTYLISGTIRFLPLTMLVDTYVAEIRFQIRQFFTNQINFCPFYIAC